MRCISGELSPLLREQLSGSWAILSGARLTVHDAVRSVVLSGSRGLKGGYRPDSDIDLSLVVDPQPTSDLQGRSDFFDEILAATLGTWMSHVELDTVAVFDRLGCGLACFDLTRFSDLRCPRMRPDCPGLYKTQKGFNGFVPAIGLQVQDVYPMMRIWSRPAAGACAAPARAVE